MSDLSDKLIDNLETACSAWDGEFEDNTCSVGDHQIKVEKNSEKVISKIEITPKLQISNEGKRRVAKDGSVRWEKSVNKDDHIIMTNFRDGKLEFGIMDTDNKEKSSSNLVEFTIRRSGDDIEVCNTYNIGQWRSCVIL